MSEGMKILGIMLTAFIIIPMGLCFLVAIIGYITEFSKMVKKQGWKESIKEVWRYIKSDLDFYFRDIEGEI